MLALVATLAPFATFATPLAPPQDRARAVRECLESYGRTGFSGAVLIARGERVEVEAGLGFADRESGRANTPDTRFEIASITKSFTAIAILQLEAAGKLALDDSIAKHLPGVPADKRDITLLHLLTHTSGMPRSAGAGRGEDLAAAVAAYLAPPRARTPGSEFEYWNGGYALLAGVIERASGMSYVQWMHERVLAPAGMTHSGFTGETFADADIAIGCDPGKAPRSAAEHPYDSYGYQYRGMGGLVTSVRDLSHFASALSGGALLEKAQKERLFTVLRGEYACGFYRRDAPRLRLSHGGEVRGFHAQLSIYPKDDVAIFVLSNAGDSPPPWTVAENLEHLWFGDPTRFALPPRTKSLSKTALDELAGTYAASDDETIEVEALGDALRLSAFGSATTLLLSPASFGAVDAVAADRTRDARKIVEALAKGDPSVLAREMASGIPERWPQDVVHTLWPEKVGVRGAVKRILLAGSASQRGADTVLLRLEQEQGQSNVRLVFEGGKLKLLDLAGPRTLASVVVAPGERDQLLRFEWQGKQPEPIQIVRSGGKATALRFKSATYRRR